MLKVGIIGGSGLTGRELIKILLNHKGTEIAYITSRQYAGEKVYSVFPRFGGLINYSFIKPSDTVFKGVDIVFTCLPHTESMGFVKKFADRGITVIDLSADYRIKSPAAYKKWYKTKHKYPSMLKKAVYGLPEINREKIKKTKILANPGCYATSVLLGLCPVVSEMNPVDIIIDSKTGISGAGANPSAITQYINVNENIIPYNAGRRHRHIGEVEDVIKNTYKKNVEIIFTPQITSLDRGILSVIYFKMKSKVSVEKVKGIFKKFYAKEPFVRIVNSINLHHVQNTNYCDINIDGVPSKNIIMVTTAIDNLLKGASGQAVQCMNIMTGFSEKEGLK